MSARPVVYICVFLSLYLFSSLSLGYGIANLNNECQDRDKIGINAAEWLVISGAVSASCITLILISVSCGVYNNSSCCSGVAFILILAVALFTFIWNIMGIVILARSSGECVSDGEPFAVYMIVLIAFSFICSGGSKSAVDSR